jgi:ribosomal protein S21
MESTSGKAARWLVSVTKREGGEVVERPETRHARWRTPAKAIEKALERLKRPVTPEELLTELETGGYGFSPEHSKAERLLNLSRAYKNLKRQTVRINEEGLYTLIKWEEK